MINNHAIKLVDSQQLLCEPIYSLKQIKLKTMKPYIKINLVKEFIKLSKSAVCVPIFLQLENK